MTRIIEARASQLEAPLLNLLAFDTSTERMSIAVQRRGQAQPWLYQAAGGAQTSTQLIPQIQTLMGQAELRFGQLDAIVFGAGPGSFTGVRTACSVAQGLGFGAGVALLPVDTLLAVAEDARAQLNASASLVVTALLDARMSEMYANSYTLKSGVWLPDKGCSVIKPEHLAFSPPPGAALWVLAGNVFEAYGARLPSCPAQRINAAPTAAALLRLAPRLLADGAALPAALALPTYVRDKVAQTTLERAALKSDPLLP